MAVGKSVPLIDAWEKVAGTAKYTTDLKQAGMLYGKILRSPYHHARVLNVDASLAERLPGVKAVLTPKDIKPVRYGFMARADQYALPIEKVRYRGEDVAAVAAVDEDTAQEALSLIKVEYEELPS
ncbi:MAG: 4-hydroxybenzoyl-CoA reductase subunit alpha, partial [Dehalococcoidia bacterium]|nr:4-hydroxybenzoyl-CoA reductase subunit alpha [Dehalococcoidia bacterium]